MAATRIVNLRKEPYDVYIGRPGPYGNPIRIGTECPICKKIHLTKGSTLPCFRTYLLSSPFLMNSLKELKGKVLGCYCKPGPCHGDVLKEYIDYDRREHLD